MKRAAVNFPQIFARKPIFSIKRTRAFWNLLRILDITNVPDIETLYGYFNVKFFKKYLTAAASLLEAIGSCSATSTLFSSPYADKVLNAFTTLTP